MSVGSINSGSVPTIGPILKITGRQTPAPEECCDATSTKNLGRDQSGAQVNCIEYRSTYGCRNDQSESRAQGNQKQVKTGPTVSELTPEEKEEVKRLQERDREVKQHEQAHKAAAGRYALGGPFYQYENGPDKRQYAVSGHVEIDTSKVPDDPEASLEKARTIKRAAMAPAEPSAKDRQVAAAASKLEAEARADILKQKTEEAKLAAEFEKADADSARPVRSQNLYSAYSQVRDPPEQKSGLLSQDLYV